MDTRILTLFAAVTLAACAGGPATTSPPPAEPVAAGDLDAPATRPFYLATTTFPQDFTPAAIGGAYDFAGAHTDLVAHHIDKGVPWPEAFAGAPYHARVETELAQRQSALPGKTRYLAISPIAVTRDGLNGYWGRQDRGARPGVWRDRDFDHPDVITAYVNYATDLVERLAPAYLVYGIEANMLAEKNPAAFEGYVAMTDVVYGRLKARFPALPLILSFHVGTVADDRAAQVAAIERLLPFTDVMAVSTYPYMATSVGHFGRRHPSPATLPADWFDQMAALAPDKPFAIAETGFPAEPFRVGQIAFDANERWQADYTKRVLQDAHRLNAEFVVWFLGQDYDALYRRVRGGPAGEVFKLFRDTGLADGGGHPRVALRIWDAWLDQPRRRGG